MTASQTVVKCARFWCSFLPPQNCTMSKHPKYVFWMQCPYPSSLKKKKKIDNMPIRMSLCLLESQQNLKCNFLPEQCYSYPWAVWYYSSIYKTQPMDHTNMDLVPCAELEISTICGLLLRRTLLAVKCKTQQSFIFYWPSRRWRFPNTQEIGDIVYMPLQDIPSWHYTVNFYVSA